MQDNASKPLISIIIASYNSADTLPACLNSVIEQTYPHKELIIIDGGSTDDTVEILASYESCIQYWISESDDGIYHAWNKALDRVNGAWIVFLGCDDVFTYPDVLADMADIVGVDNDIEFLSGQARILDDEGKFRFVKGNLWQWSDFKYSMETFVHPGAFHSKRLFERLGKFDPGYQIAGDYEFLLRAGPSLNVAFIPKIIVERGGSGVSQKFPIKAYWEVYRAQRRSPFIKSYEARLNFLVNVSKCYAGLGLHHLRRKFKLGKD